MRKNVNLKTTSSYIPLFGDGSVVVCQVDQFPVKDKSLFKENGFPRSDIGIIDRLSTLNMDRDLIEQISARMMDTSVRSPYEGLSDDEMLRVLRPANVQTATEYKFYSESVYHIMRENSEILRKTSTTSSTDDVDASVTSVQPNEGES